MEMWRITLPQSNGVSSSPVNAETEDPCSISRNNTFPADSMNPLFLESTLSYLTEEIAA